MNVYLVKIYNSFLPVYRIIKIRIFYRLRIISSKKTIQKISKGEYSISRFGDGEINQILEKKSIGFQEYSDKLAVELMKVLENRNKKLLICVPRTINCLVGYNQTAKSFWISWGNYGFHERVVKLLRQKCGRHYLFGDTQVTRPYMDYKSEKRASKQFRLLKKIWENKDILIVEGNQTCLGVGNDLFANCKSIKRIVVPSVNAFDSYEEILESILRNRNNRLVLLAIGPTATVLASDLCNKGIQALDIGHIDIEYEWYLLKAKEKVAILGKYTNEVDNGTNAIAECFDQEYRNQIIESVQ